MTCPRTFRRRMLVTSAAGALLVGACSSSNNGNDGNTGGRSVGNTGGTSAGNSDNTGGTSVGNNQPLGAEAFGQKYKIADNALPGWTLDANDPAQNPEGTFGTYTATTLNNKINGGSTAYTGKGMQVAMYEDMSTANGEYCRVIAMDFGTEGQAADMVAFEKDKNASDITIPGYPAAIASSVLGGMTVFSHKKSLYIQLELTGFGSDTDAVIAAAKAFLQALEAKAD